MVAPDDVRIDALSVYEAALNAWAARTASSPEPRWRGPGVYRFGGYMDDGRRPAATLERLEPTVLALIRPVMQNGRHPRPTGHRGRADAKPG